MKVSQPVGTDGHSFHNLKLTFSKKNVFENLHMPRISWSMAIHKTNTIELSEYSSVLNLLLCTLSLEYDRNYEEATNEPEGEEVYYVEPDLSGGIEGIDYDIVYGIEEEERKIEP